MAIPLGTNRRELLARTIADLGKGVFAVGLASRFFKDFDLAIRILLGGAIIVLVVVSLWIQPDKNEEKAND